MSLSTMDDFGDLVQRAADPTSTSDDLRDLIDEINDRLETKRQLERFAAVSRAALANPNIDPSFGYDFFLTHSTRLTSSKTLLDPLLGSFFGNQAMTFWLLSGEAAEPSAPLKDVTLLLLRELPLGTKPMNFEGVGHDFYRTSLDAFFGAVGHLWENNEWMDELVMMLDHPFHEDDRWQRWSHIENQFYDRAHHDPHQNMGTTSALFVLRYLWQHLGYEGHEHHRSWPEVFAFFLSLSSFQPSPALLTRAKVVLP